MTTNNLFSNLMGNATPPAPEVGMGATACYYSDRHAFTILTVSASGKTLTMRRDNAKRIDSHGMSDAQEYDYTPDPFGGVFKATLRSTGKWKLVGSSTRNVTTVLINTRREFYDYTF